MFYSLVEEVRYCIEGSGSRGRKGDRQHAFLGNEKGRIIKNQRANAREKHGHPEDPDSAFPLDKDGRATRPGHGSGMDKVRAAIFNRKFKYGDKHKRSAVGPKGKLPG
jgi:hypothetical protein